MTEKRLTRRRLQATTALAALAFPAIACGTSASTESGSTAQTGGPKLRAGSTITFWNDMTGAYPGLMQRWGDSFQQQTGVKVEVSGGIAQYADKLSASFAGGTPPDVYRYLQANTPLPAAVERNMLLKLDALAKRDKLDVSDFRKESINLYRWKGSLYALPRDYGLQLIFYNADLFQREGIAPIPTDWNDKTWTFQKFLEVCQKIARGGDRYALFVPRGNRLWASFVYSNGGQIVKKNQDGLATEFVLQERPATDALQFMQDLFAKHKVAPVPAEESALGGGSAKNQVALMQAGKLAMYISNPGSNNNFLPTGMPYDVGVFPLGSTGRRGVGGGGTGWAISAPTQAQEEAWALVTQITSREGQLGEVEIGQTTPSRISVATGKEYLAPDKPPKGKKAFADGQEYVVQDPVHSRWPDANRDVVTKLLNEQLWTGQQNAAQVTKEIKDKGDLLFKG